MPVLEVEERVARLEGRVDEHSKFFESLSVKLTLLDDKGDRNRESLEKRIDITREGLEKKIDITREGLERKIEGLEQKIDQRFIGIDQRFAQIDQRFIGIDQRINGTNQRIDRLFFFILATLVSSIGSLIAAVVSIIIR